MIQVHGEHPLRVDAGGVEYGRSKCSIAVAEKYLDLISLVGCYREIELAVVIEIAQRGVPNRDVWECHRSRCSKGTIAVAQECLDP